MQGSFNSCAFGLILQFILCATTGINRVYPHSKHNMPLSVCRGWECTVWVSMVCAGVCQSTGDLTKCVLAPCLKTYCAPHFSAAFFLELLLLQDPRWRGPGCLARVVTLKEPSDKKCHAASQRRAQSLWGHSFKRLISQGHKWLRHLRIHFVSVTQ